MAEYERFAEIRNSIFPDGSHSAKELKSFDTISTRNWDSRGKLVGLHSQSNWNKPGNGVTFERYGRPCTGACLKAHDTPLRGHPGQAGRIERGPSTPRCRHNNLLTKSQRRRQAHRKDNQHTVLLCDRTVRAGVSRWAACRLAT